MLWGLSVVSFWESPPHQANSHDGLGFHQLQLPSGGDTMALMEMWHIREGASEISDG